MFLSMVVLLMLAHSALSCTEIQANTSCCKLCPAGYHAGEKCLAKTNPQTYKCVKCLKGSFTAIINSIDKCLRCSGCKENQVQTQDCVYNNDRKCACQDGYYQENPDTLCKPCVNDCKGHVVCVARCPTTNTPTFPTQKENSSSTTPSNPSFSKADQSFFKVHLVILLTLVVTGILILIMSYLTTSRKACLRREKDLELSAKNLQHNGNPEITSMSVFQANQPRPVRTSTTQSGTEDLIHVTPLLPNPQVGIPRQETQPDRIPATVLYAIIKEVPLRRWKEFLRLLAVPERQIERVELEAGMVTGSLERQYLMLRLWSQQPAATLDHVYSALQYMELTGCADQLQSSLDQMQWCTGAGRLVTQPVTSPQPNRIMETWVMNTEL
ncbi:tumor necrosis factor receptor superfamily member 1A isoform X3 [Hypomesus transpacificus]|uniref:tumor necrosis factor receptor superfamily member 1A isoform X3 n=1 Tax=Hypomesus transpacificus TaxID=137520 RepID=UPI001F0722B9|nr:tumor necrosis factor receptor superfamily member 1A isoform X3 [Hypomesus transpacificus]